MFPIIEKYVDHIHSVNGQEAKVINKIAKELEENFNKLMTLIKQGKKVVFTDVENDVKIMLKQLSEENFKEKKCLN